MDHIKKSWWTLLICLVLPGATLTIFWPVSHYGIIYYDDPQYVTENPQVTEGLTWSSVKWAMAAVCAGNWHPLTLMSHMLDVQLFGLNIGRHHLVNLLFHTVNSLLLFLLLKRMTGTIWRSAFVAALFALHPLHVESVAWLAERKDVLSAFFFMVAIGAYVRYADARVKCQMSSVKLKDSGRQGQKSEVKGQTPDTHHGTGITYHASRITHHALLFYVLALILFALGLMSKPMLVTLPFVLLLLDYWPLSRFPSSSIAVRPSPFTAYLRLLPRLLSEKAPFFVLSAASCVATFLAQNSSGAVNSLEQVPFERRLGNAVVSCVAYLKQAFWPTDLAILYPYPAVLPDGQVIGAVMLLAGISTGALLLLRRRPYVAIGWFWFLGMLVPVIGLVQVGEQARADRYTYLPLIGTFVMLAWGVPDLVAQIFNLLYRRLGVCGARRPVGWEAGYKPAIQQIENLRYRAEPPSGVGAWTLSVGALAALSVLAWIAHRQVVYWRSSYALFEHAAEVTEANYVASGGIGIALLHEGNYNAAVTNLTRALELARSRGAGGGIKYYLGAALQLQGNGLEALPYLQEAVVGPDLLPQRNLRLGLSLLEAGRVAEAEVALKQALDARPRDPEFQLARAVLFHSQGKDTEAERLFRDIVAAHPEMAQAHRSYGDFLNLLGRPADAEAQYATSVKLASPDVGLLRAYSSVLARLGKTGEAVRQLEEAAHKDPGNAQVSFELAELLSEQGRKPEAVARYNRALETNPKLVSALNNLAWTLATDPDARIRDGARAVELAERACECAEWKAAVLMGTLAAAYAEAGRFADAVRMAERARDQARTDKQEAVARRNEELLELYRADKPFREGK